MARWTASAKWAAGPALDGQRDMPLALRLSEGLGRSWWELSFKCFDLDIHSINRLLQEIHYFVEAGGQPCRLEMVADNHGVFLFFKFVHGKLSGHYRKVRVSVHLISFIKYYLVQIGVSTRNK